MECFPGRGQSTQGVQGREATAHTGDRVLCHDGTAHSGGPEPSNLEKDLVDMVRKKPVRKLIRGQLRKLKSSKNLPGVVSSFGDENYDGTSRLTK